jgi:hypothetical protein
MKIAGSGSGSESGSISQRHGSADPYPDPDPPQNVLDPQHSLQCKGSRCFGDRSVEKKVGLRLDWFEY